MPLLRRLLAAFALLMLWALPALAQDTRIVQFEDQALLPDRLSHPIAISGDGRGYNILCQSQADEERVIRGLGFVSLPSEVLTAVDPQIINARAADNPALCPTSEAYPIKLFVHDEAGARKYYLQFPTGFGSADFVERLYVPGCLELTQALNLDLATAQDSDPTPFFANRIHEIKCVGGTPIPGPDTTPVTFEDWCMRPDLVESQVATIRAILLATPFGAGAIGDARACKSADTFLKGLRTLNLDGTGVRSAEPLAPLTELTSLSLAGNPMVDIGPLSGLTKLTRLNVSSTAIRSIAALSPMADTLVDLDASHNEITDIRQLSSLTHLIRLNLDGNQIEDFGPLEQLAELTTIDVSNNPATSIAPLMELPKLANATLGGMQLELTTMAQYCFVHNHDGTALGLDEPFMVALDTQMINQATPLTADDLKDCAKVSVWAANVRNLELGHAEIVSIAPIRFFPQLRELSLTDNAITDASPLAGLTRLTDLDLSGNRLRSAPVLSATGLWRISLGRNGMDDASSLASLVSLNELYIEENKLTDVSPIADLEHLDNLYLDNNLVSDPDQLLRLLPLKPHMAGNPVCTGARVTAVFDTVADDFTNWAPAHGINPAVIPPIGAAAVEDSCDIRKAADIYAIKANGDLMFYRHYGYRDGTEDWSNPNGVKIGNGWNFRQVLAGPEGSLFAIRDDGDMLWYRHLGYHDGTADFAPDGGTRIGNGWAFKQAFTGPEGSIYVVTESGDLMFFRNLGYRGDATAAADGWLYGEGVQVGNGWNFQSIFAGDGGSIYGITTTGELLYYRHNDYRTGNYDWWDGGGTVIGTGWNNFRQVFAGPEGAIYAIDNQGQVHFYRHYGYLDGSNSWWPGGGTVIGTGWDYIDVMARR